MELNYINCENFKKRMVDLCLRSGLSDFPSKRRDQLVLLKSIAISFDPQKVYTEVAINDNIKLWLAKVDCFPNWDYLMLRRRLIDNKFLTRNPDGSGYWLCSSDPAEMTFDPTIAKLDICEVIDEGQKFIAQKKAEYLQNHSDSL
jgi:hypothetical protein